MKNKSEFFVSSGASLFLVLSLLWCFSSSFSVSASPFVVVTSSLIFTSYFALIAKLVEPYLTQSAVTNISFVGSMMIFCVGVNLMFDKKIRVANMLPTIIFSVAFSFIPI